MTLADELQRVIPDTSSLGQPNPSAKRDLEVLFAGALGLDPSAVYAVNVAKAGNLSKALVQSDRAMGASVGLALVLPTADMEGVLRSARKRVGPGQKKALVVVSRGDHGAWVVSGVVEQPDGVVTRKLSREWPTLTPWEPMGVHGARVAPRASMAVPLAMDDRTNRMARLAVATSPAVLFVGPPGTGKNRLLEEILEEIRVDPSSYGFTQAYPVALEPAEEGWTTRDLVGGETVEEGSNRLRFRPGRVLDAVSSNRWLVIDEANRADLDRIFGGLLTWLSGQDVVVGRASTRVGAPLVRLRWGTAADSSAVGVERLAADEVGDDPIDFIAGTEFRLLGTYNALDAQRVFRFGLALGRRFSQVPIPPAGPAAFHTLLDAQAVVITDEEARARVVAAVNSLYRAHLATPGAALGPAMFLTLPDYVQKGLQLADLSEIEGEGDPVSSLVAEGYLLATGSWLARLDPTEAPELEARLTADWTDRDGASVPAPIAPQQWRWITGQLPIIGG